MAIYNVTQPAKEGKSREKNLNGLFLRPPFSLVLAASWHVQNLVGEKDPNCVFQPDEHPVKKTSEIASFLFSLRGLHFAPGSGGSHARHTRPEEELAPAINKQEALVQRRVSRSMLDGWWGNPSPSWEVWKKSLLVTYLFCDKQTNTRFIATEWYIEQLRKGAGVPSFLPPNLFVSD